MIEKKWYLVTMTGMFLSLALGMLIASAILSDDLVVSQQSEVIRRLERELTRQQNELALLEQRLSGLEINEERLNSFLQDLLPPLLMGRLEETRVAIVYLGEQELAVKVITDWVESAGATVISTIGIPSRTDIEKPETLARDIANGTICRDSMVGESCLEESPDAVVFLTTGTRNQREIDRIDSVMIKVWQSLELTVIVGEQTWTTPSVVGHYRDVTTIDNLDTLTGLASLILSLGGQTGSFGFKSSAESIWPGWPEEG